LSWDDWLSSCGYEGTPVRIGGRYSYYTDAVSAALNGQGIVLGWQALIRPDLAAGRLRRLTTHQVVSSSAHFAVASRSARKKPGALAFVAWLLAQERE
jgi:DNA-binding transcriptional LysR family regulator